MEDLGAECFFTEEGFRKYTITPNFLDLHLVRQQEINDWKIRSSQGQLDTNR